MKKYYTKACNFYYGKTSVKLVNQKKTFPLNGNKEISFNQIEIISRNSKKKIDLENIKKISSPLKKKIIKDIKVIIKKKKKISQI
jgi:dihydropteroate synthase